MHGSEFTMVEELVAQGEGGGGHLVDYQTQEIMSRLWTRYLARVRDGLDDPFEAMTVMRRVTQSLESECFPGQKLGVGIKVTGRTNRGFTFDAALWHADSGQLIARSEMVTVTVSPEGTGAVTIPQALWSEVERIEGREIPPTPRD